MYKKAPLFSFKYILYDLVKWFAWWQCLIFYRVKKYFDGIEAKKHIRGGAIIVSNHVAFSDPFVLQSTFLYRRFHFLGMEELFQKKAKAWIYKNIFLTIPVSRTKPALTTIKKSADLVANGNILAIFPEGHINTDLENVDAFKGGAILIAYRAGVPIIPVYHQKRKTIWNMTRMVIGKPIDVKSEIGPILTQEKIKQLSIKLHNYENQLMEMCNQKKSK